MIIKKMTAWFGALDGRTLELSDGLNVLYAPNESGKSTWCAFLKAMLYGVSTSQRGRAGQKPDRTKYKPWSGSPMSGSMELLTPDGPITIRRWTERDNQPMQAFSATVTGTEMPVYGLTADTAGQALTGVGETVFERSAFIRQSGMELQNEPELDRRISAIVSGGDEEVSFLEAEKRLRAWQRRRRNGRRGAIPELQASLEETRRTLEMIRAHGETAAAAGEEIARLEAEERETTARMHQARAEQRKAALAAMGGARKAVQEAEELRRGAEASLRAAEDALDETPYGSAGPDAAEARSAKDMQTAAALARAAEKKPPMKLALIPLVLAAAAFLLTFFLPWKQVCAGIGGILILAAAVLFLGLQSLQRRRENALAERQRILAAYGASDPAEIPARLEEYRGAWQRKERAKLRLETAEAALEEKRAAQKRTEARAMNDLDFSRGDNEAARAGRKAEELRGRITVLKERRAMAEGQARALGDPMALESELAEGERTCTALLRQEEALSLALEALTQADGELQQRLSPKLAQRAAEYFAFLTDGRYDEVTLTRDLTGKARLSGDAVGRELDYLSAGAKDQLYLALRLAVCDMVLPEEDPCPVILDDALVAFDRERMARALELMRRIAAERQVLIFTCHERECAYFADDPQAHVLTISGENEER